MMAGSPKASTWIMLHVAFFHVMLNSTTEFLDTNAASIFKQDARTDECPVGMMKYPPPVHTSPPIREWGRSKMFFTWTKVRYANRLDPFK